VAAVADRFPENGLPSPVHFRFCTPAATYKIAEFRAKHLVSGLALVFATGCGCFFREKGLKTARRNGSTPVVANLFALVMENVYTNGGVRRAW